MQRMRLPRSFNPLILRSCGGDATTLLRYDGGISTGFGGDVQRLDNGNLLITYSSSGVIQELGPDNSVLQTFTFPIGGTLSYMEKRRSLYSSPPPKINGI